MAHLHLLPLLLLLLSAAAVSAAGDEAHVSAVVAETGLAFAKDVLIGEAVRSLTPLRLPGVEKAVRVPFLGGFRVAASNITLFHLDVGDNSTIYPGYSGLVVVASGITANLSMHWSYCYDSWLFPLEITDSGTASILVQGIEVGITMAIKNSNGSLALSVSQCGCYVKNLVISLDGGASWFYQGFINAFEDHIKAAVEKAIPENIMEGAGKLDSFLQGLPRSVSLDNVAALNMTFVNDPHYGNSSIEFDINGLITSAVAKTNKLQMHPHLSLSCGGASKMLLLSLDEDVFNSALEVYFKAGSMHWIVDKVPDQSLLNTASWKFIIPRLYWSYPNDDMLLNISMASSPVIRITSEKIGATINADMIIDVLDGKETVPVACISVVVSASGVVETSGNKVYGRVSLDNFSLALKWSKIGNFYMSLIQGVIRVFLNTVCMPYLNSRLGNGFVLPVVHGFTLEGVYVRTSAEQLTLCSDVTVTNASSLASLPVL
ncbi:putative BPI/LBP family protein At1g04970 [Phragmites australis]|uniref:putative BPI/LBP family protein At1g04970 n=1 Tax=Phragmites australis TaxID=29695 RepID=UPI002D7702F7|nr:putative BPI/LBP family protein At1g04970 [Phragmites australis]